MDWVLSIKTHLKKVFSQRDQPWILAATIAVLGWGFTYVLDSITEQPIIEISRYKELSKESGSINCETSRQSRALKTRHTITLTNITKDILFKNVGLTITPQSGRLHSYDIIAFPPAFQNKDPGSCVHNVLNLSGQHYHPGWIIQYYVYTDPATLIVLNLDNEVSAIKLQERGWITILAKGTDKLTFLAESIPQ